MRKRAGLIGLAASVVVVIVATAGLSLARPHSGKGRAYGKGHTLPGFWTTCESCERRYAAGEDDTPRRVTIVWR